MKVSLHITCDNAAFDDGNEGGEVARILRDVAKRLDGQTLGQPDEFSLRDINGNVVGRCQVVQD